MKKLKILGLVISMSILVGCGGGGGGGSTPLYSKIQDLEFKTLNISETWKVNGKVFYTTMKFTNKYTHTSSGTPALIDETSSSYYVKLCAEAPAGGVGPNGEELRYLCVGVFGSGSVAAWGLHINNDGIISGNFHFSSIGDAGGVGVAVSSPTTAYAIVGGGVSATVAAAEGQLIASSDGVGFGGIQETNVDDDINKEKSYSDIASSSSQTQGTEELSPEKVKVINELYESLLQIASEK